MQRAERVMRAHSALGCERAFSGLKKGEKCEVCGFEAKE
jgi:hypothetical protein